MEGGIPSTWSCSSQVPLQAGIVGSASGIPSPWILVWCSPAGKGPDPSVPFLLHKSPSKQF